MRKRTKRGVSSNVARPSRAIGYIRVSTLKQANGGLSLEAQKERILQYAEITGLEIVDFEVDAGFSASTTDRPALKRALERLDRFEANTLVVVKLDRLSRNVRDMCELVSAYFRDGQCTLVSVFDHIDTSSANGRMILNILMSLAEWERESAAERTQEVMHHMKATGKYTGGWPPFGWTADDKGVLVVNEVEQQIIERAKDLRAQGMSMCKVAREIGLNPRTGNKFDDKAVQRMLADSKSLADAGVQIVE